MTDSIATAQLRAFVERIERVEAEIKELNSDKSEIYKELRGVGFDVKAVRQCVAARKLDSSDLAERNAIFDTYWAALTGASHVHVHEGSQELPPHDRDTGEIIEDPNSAGKASEQIDPSADHVSPPARIRTTGSGSANTGGEDVTDGELLKTDNVARNDGQTSLAAREGEKPLHSNSNSSAPAPSLEQTKPEAGSSLASGTNPPETANEIPAQDSSGTATGESPCDKSKAAQPASEQELADADLNDGTPAGQTGIEVVTGGERPAPIPEPFEPPQFLVKAAKPLRPLCLNPTECAGYGTHTCHRCLKAAGQSEAA